MGYFTKMFTPTEEKLIEQARSEIKKDELKWARNTVDKLLKLYPQSQKGLMYKAILELASDFKAAEDLFRQVLKKDPKCDDCWYYLAKIYDEQQKFKDTLYCWEKALEINPSNVEYEGFKEEMLFLLKMEPEMKKYREKLFKRRLNDKEFLKEHTVMTSDGTIVGSIQKTDPGTIHVLIAESTKALEPRPDPKDIVRLRKKSILSINHVVVIDSKSIKLQRATKKCTKNEILQHTVIFSDGKIAGQLDSMDKKQLRIIPEEHLDVRMVKTDEFGRVIMPMDSLLAYENDVVIVKELEIDPHMKVTTSGEVKTKFEYIRTIIDGHLP